MICRSGNNVITSCSMNCIFKQRDKMLGCSDVGHDILKYGVPNILPPQPLPTPQNSSLPISRKSSKIPKLLKFSKIIETLENHTALRKQN